MAETLISKEPKNARNVIISKISKAFGICLDILNNFLGNKKNTYCPFLWNRIQINMHGNVFACCFSAPWVLGNIYTSHLDKIWQKSIRLNIARWLSLNGSLHCFKNCFLSKLNISNVERIHASNHPATIMIQLGDMCNITCIMCGRDRTSTIVLDNDVLKKNVNWESFKEITLGGGEVLFMEKAKELYLWLTTVKHKKVNIYTNGLLIDDEWAEHLLKGSDWIYISVNAASEKTYREICGSDFFQVINNIKKLISLKRKLELDVGIIYHFTIIRNNVHEIADAVRFANDLGCDTISFGSDAGATLLIQGNSELREKLKGEISQLINNKEIKIKILKEHLISLGILDM